ncbi:TPA: hypothetical protein ACU9Q5_001272, partial [Legionella anisa]
DICSLGEAKRNPGYGSVMFIQKPGLRLRLHPGYTTVIPVDLEYLFSWLNFVRNSQGQAAGRRHRGAQENSSLLPG